jgi:hypothetical protein
VQSPARQAPLGVSAPMPDPITMYRGLAMFVTTNTTKKLS